MRGALCIIWGILSPLGMIDAASALGINNPINGTYWARNFAGVINFNGGSAGVSTTLTQKYPNGTSAIVGTQTFTTITGSLTVPASALTDLGIYSYVVTQSGVSSPPVMLNVIRFDVLSPISGGIYPPYTNIIAKYKTSVSAPITGLLTNYMLANIDTNSQTTSGALGSYTGSYTIPASAIVGQSGLSLQFYVGIGTSASVYNVKIPFSTGGTGSPPFPTSYIAQSTLPVNQDFTVYYQASYPSVVTATVTTTTGSIVTTTSTPTAKNSGYAGNFVLTAAQLSQSGSVTFTLSQTNAGSTSTSPVYTYGVQGTFTINGYDSGSSTYASNNLPLISATNAAPTDYFSVVVTNTETTASSTQYYAATLNAGQYTSAAFNLSASTTVAVPVPGRYTLVVAANGASITIVYTISAPPPPVFTSPSNNSYVPPSAPVSISYTASSLAVVNFNTVGATTFTNTSTPTSSGSQYTGSITIYPSSGTYTITMTQNGMLSLPLVITAAVAPQLTSPSANSYNALNTDLVLAFTTATSAVLTVNTTYNGQVISQTTTPIAAASTYSATVTLPASSLTIPGEMLIVAVQGLASPAVKIYIGSPNAPPAILTLTNGAIIKANTALNIDYTAAALTTVSITATPYNGNIANAAYSSSASPALVGSVIMGNFVIPAGVTAYTTLQIVLAQTIQGTVYTSNALIVVPYAAPTITSSTTSPFARNILPNVSATLASISSGPTYATIKIVNTDTAASVSANYPVANNAVGPFNLNTSGKPVAPLGNYALIVTYAGIDSTPFVYAITNPAAPTISAPRSGATVTVSTQQPLNIIYTPAMNWAQQITFTLESQSSRKRAVYTESVTPPLAGGVANIAFIGDQAPASGLYALSVSQQTPEGILVHGSTWNININAFASPVIVSPANQTSIAVYRPLVVTYTTDATVITAVTIVMVKPDATTFTGSNNPISGSGSVTFDASQFVQSGAYTLKISQTLTDGTLLTGLPVVLTSTASPPIIVAPLNNSYVLAASFSAQYNASSNAPITAELSSSSLTNTQTITPTSIPGSIYGGNYTIVITPGIISTIILIQNGLPSDPLLVTGVATPILSQPAANSYNQLGADLVIVFTAFSSSTVSVDATYNGQTISNSSTPTVQHPALLQGSVTIPSGQLSVIGNMSIVFTQDTFSSPPFVINIGNQPAAPLITSLANNTYVRANTDLSFTYNATALSAVGLTATPSSSGTSFTNSNSPTLTGSLISGSFTIPAASVQSTLRITLTQGVYMSIPLTIFTVNPPAISNPQNNGKIGLNRDLTVSFTSDVTLTNNVTVTLTKPDSSTLVKTSSPIAGVGSSSFVSSDIAQPGTYSLGISQLLPDGTTLLGSVILLATGVIPTVTGIITGTNYTQNDIMAPTVKVPTTPDITTVAVTLTFQAVTRTINYPLVDQEDGTSLSYPIQLNHPYSFGGNDREFAYLGNYSLSIEFNGVTSDPMSYELVAAAAPSINYPLPDGSIVVSKASPLIVVFLSPPNYNFDIAFTLTKNINPGRNRRADGITIKATPDPEQGGGSATFSDDNAPTTSGTYTLSVSQLAPDGTSINGDSVTFPITVSAASNAAGKPRKIRRQVRKARCTELETECLTSSGSFQCIDTMTELTSCGGCNPNFRADSPYDCTLIARAKGVGCAQGRCVVFSCEGYSFVPNDSQTACIRRR